MLANVSLKRKDCLPSLGNTVRCFEISLSLADLYLQDGAGREV